MLKEQKFAITHLLQDISSINQVIFIKNAVKIVLHVQMLIHVLLVIQIIIKWKEQVIATMKLHLDTTLIKTITCIRLVRYIVLCVIVLNALGAKVERILWKEQTIAIISHLVGTIWILLNRFINHVNFIVFNVLARVVLSVKMDMYFKGYILKQVMILNV